VQARPRDERGHPGAGAPAQRTGELLRRLVDRISHRSGAALAIMEQAGLTLPQLLLLARVARLGRASLSALAEASGASLPAASQMSERLVRQGLLARADDPADRRRRALAPTRRGREVLARVGAARAADYAVSLEAVPAPLLRALAEALAPIVERIE
jgi:DNA-binding MarR family transcriptional regulator